MAPTSTCFKSVRYQDDLDIVTMTSAQTKMVSLEPLSRRGKVKKVRQRDSAKTSDPVPGLTRTSTDQSVVSSRHTSSLERPPMSPAPSEATVRTGTTASTQSFQIITRPIFGTDGAAKSNETRSTNTCSSKDTITATIELARQGALPEDSIALRVLVQHTKAVRGVVIVTLYRQARVDMHPAIPMARNGKGKEQEYEDIYPKSRTGLGGLYFANGSPSSTFRMDVAQTSTLMVVDPHSLTADVRTSIRVPKDAMPTTANVPGDMISFRYYIEVVVDINGKLRETRFLPSLTSNGPSFTYAAGTNNQLTSEWANTIMDTTQIRRNKSVVCHKFGLVVGTRDSGRSARQRQQLQEGTEDCLPEDHDAQMQHEPYNEEYEDQHWPHDPEDFGTHPDSSGLETWDYHVPPTQLILPSEAGDVVDEKTRLRTEEELLLPSQPAGGSGGVAASQDFAPSAPFILESTAMHFQQSSSAVSDGIANPSGVSARSFDTICPHTEPIPHSSELNLEEGEECQDDKQELERQRLMREASAPPETEENGVTRGSAVASVTTYPPTAPIIHVEEEEYTNGSLAQVQQPKDQLPRYER